MHKMRALKLNSLYLQLYTHVKPTVLNKNPRLQVLSLYFQFSVLQITSYYVDHRAATLYLLFKTSETIFLIENEKR